MFALCITASAAGDSSLNGDSSVSVGNNIELVVKVNGCDDATSIAVAITSGDNFELVSGTWLKDGSIKTFDATTQKGALGGLSTPDVNGDLFKIVLKAKKASKDLQNVNVNVIAKNGSTEIMNVTPAKSVQINCATHNYGEYSQKDANNHIRTCSECGDIETNVHTWDNGVVTNNATCKEDGVKTYTCTATGCGAKKTETIEKTDHTYGDWAQTKAPTCLESGTETRTCLICDKSETKDIKATGHKMDNSVVIKEPTCSEEGIKEGICTVCGTKNEEKIAKTEHTYGDWVVTSEATSTTEGSKEKICLACEHKIVEKIPVVEESTSSNSSPKTGDNMAIILCIVVLMSAAVGIVFAIRKIRASAYRAY